MQDNNPHDDRIFLYVPFSWVNKAFEVGWESPSDLGPPHNHHSVLMEWKKGGEPVMPFKSKEKRYERR
jgi:hypothetical protein